MVPPVLTAQSYKEGPGHDGPSFSAMVLIDGVKAVEVYDGAFGGEFEYRWQTTDPDQRNAWQEVIRQAGIDWGLRDTRDYCWTDEQKAHMRAHRTENPIPPLEGAGQDGTPWTPYSGINRDCLIDDLMEPLRDRKQMIRRCAKSIPYRLPNAPRGEWQLVTTGQVGRGVPRHPAGPAGQVAPRRGPHHRDLRTRSLEGEAAPVPPRPRHRRLQRRCEMTRSFDTPLCRLIAADVQEALKSVGEKHGMTITYEGGRYGDFTLDMKVKATITTEGGQPGDFAKHARLIGLPEDCWGKTFVSLGSGESATITGIKLSRRKYPVSATTERGRQIKCPVAMVKHGLEMAAGGAK